MNGAPPAQCACFLCRRVSTCELLGGEIARVTIKLRLCEPCSRARQAEALAALGVLAIYDELSEAR